MALRRPFEGKGRQLVWADPDRSWLGFFYACCCPCRVELPGCLPRGGQPGRGAARRGTSRSVVPLLPPAGSDTAGNTVRCVPGHAHVACVVSGEDPQEESDDH